MDALDLDAEIQVSDDGEVVTGDARRRGPRACSSAGTARRSTRSSTWPSGSPSRDERRAQARGDRRRRLPRPPRRALQAQADQAVEDALRFSRPVALDAMTRARPQRRARVPARSRRRRDVQRGRRARPPPRGRAAARASRRGRSRPAFHVFHTVKQPPVRAGRDRARVTSSAGVLVGVLIGEGSFGGDGKQPQVTLRMHTRHEALFRWLDGRAFRAPSSTGPYHHGGRSYFQWMARGPALVEDVLPVLEEPARRRARRARRRAASGHARRYADYIARVRAR